jgi:putative endonuclease
LDKTAIGQNGEHAAVVFLKNKGFQVIQTNYRVAGAEVDIIALTGRILCFVEVKTRKSGDYGLPEAFVHLAKQRKIIRAAKFFSTRKAYREYQVRFDVVSIISDENGMVFDHLENAFEE